MQPASHSQIQSAMVEVEAVDERYHGRRAPLCAFALTLAMYFSTQWTEGQVTLGFYRSLVECDPPTPERYNVTDNETGENVPTCCRCPSEGSRYDDAEEVCLPPTPDSPHWTASGRCHDKTYVVSESQRVIGATTTGTNLVSGFSTIFFAASLIDMWGRKPMLVLCFLAQVLEGLCYVAVTQNGANLVQAAFWIWMTVGISAVLDTSLASASAMAADGTVPDSPDRYFRMIIFQAMRAGAGMVAYASDAIILGFKLEDYGGVWPPYAAFVFAEMTLAYFLLVETKPTINKFSKMTIWQACGTVKSEILAAFEIITSDRKLFLGMLANGIANTAFGVVLVMFPAWSFLVLGMSQSEAVIVQLTFNLFWIIFLFVSPVFAKHLGNMKTFVFGMFWIGLGMALCAGNETMLWVGMIMMPIGAGIEQPAFMTILSSRVAPENLGKYFALQGLLMKLMSSVSIFAVSNVYLGNPGDDYTFRMTTVWIGVGVMLWVATLIVLWAYGWNYEGAAAEPKPGGAFPAYAVGRSGSRIIDEATIQTERTTSRLKGSGATLELI